MANTSSKDNNTVVVQQTTNNVVTTEIVEQVIVRSQGERGAKGSSILKGTGIPSNSVGLAGDYYLDLNTYFIYGPKPESGWDLNDKFSLQGIDGASFLTGSGVPSNSLGKYGDTYLDTDTGTLYKKGQTGWDQGVSILNPNEVSFTYEKQSASNHWSVVHNLRYKPSVTVSDYGQNNVECDVEHISSNELALTFSEPMSGYAYLS